MKKHKYAIFILLIIILFYIIENKKSDSRKMYSLSVINAGENQILSVTRNGENWTEEYNELKIQTENAIAEYLQTPPEHLKFSCYTMLGMEGMTENAKYQNKNYLFICDMEGNVLSSKIVEE